MIVARKPEDLAGLDRPLVVSIGVFDGMHVGHRAVLAVLAEEAASADAATVVITLDPHPVTVLRPDVDIRLLTTAQERAVLLDGPEAPDALFIHPFNREVAALTPMEFLRGALPAKARLAGLVVGYDFRMGKDRSGGFDELAEAGKREGFRTRRVAATELAGAPVSSTRIRDLVAGGRVREAAEWLGHPYLIVGDVVGGRGIGRTLDFPTANVDVGDERKLLPEFGVYAVRVRILDGKDPAKRRSGVVNLGVRPTFGTSDPVLEVHLPGFSGDLTGRRLAVEVIERIRPERRFESPDALAEQIARDVTEARKILQDHE